MEDTKFPIIIKKRNGLMLIIAIIEITIGIIFGITGEGVKNVMLWIFVFIGIITAMSILAEYSQDVILKEDKIEFYKNSDLIKGIKYSNISSIFMSKGQDIKTKKKDFVAIGYSESNKKGSISLSYFINPMSYSGQDLNLMKSIISNRNPSVKVHEEVEKFIK